MNYTLAAIVEQEDVDERFVPRIVDRSGTVGWTPGEGPARTFTASGVTVYRGAVNPGNRFLRVKDVSIAVHITSERLVAVCRNYDKGGGWIGSAGAMVVLNAVSKARAAIRSHGKFLVAQVRWPWLVEVRYVEKTDWKSTNQLRLVALDQAGRLLIADFRLPKDIRPRAVGSRILASACAHRGCPVPELPSYDPHARQFVGARLADPLRPPAR
jgi:hypothetical protein